VSCLLCCTSDEVQLHHVAPGVLELTVPLCKARCHPAQTDRQYRAGVFGALGSEIGEAWSFAVGFSGLQIELARATGARELVELGERLRHAAFGLLSALGEDQTGPVPVRNALREHPEPAVSIGEQDAVRAARRILAALSDGAREWLGKSVALPELTSDADLPGLMNERIALLESLARAQLEEPEHG
jgi:hypothetical protein